MENLIEQVQRAFITANNHTIPHQEASNGPAKEYATGCPHTRSWREINRCLRSKLRCVAYL
eukprot:480468-Amphidinium_carterae.2